jgi:hypothetical protein
MLRRLLFHWLELVASAVCAAAVEVPTGGLQSAFRDADRHAEVVSAVTQDKEVKNAVRAYQRRLATFKTHLVETLPTAVLDAIMEACALPSSARTGETAIVGGAGSASVSEPHSGTPPVVQVLADALAARRMPSSAASAGAGGAAVTLVGLFNVLDGADACADSFAKLHERMQAAVPVHVDGDVSLTFSVRVTASAAAPLAASTSGSDISYS